MNKVLGPVAASTGILLLAAGAAFAVRGGFDEDDSPASAESVRDTANEDVGTEPAADQAGGSAAGMCAEGVPDCVDTIVDPDGQTTNAGPASNPDEPVTSDPNSGEDNAPDECSLSHNIDACQEQAVAVTQEDLVNRTGVEPDLISIENVEWPDASLGNPEPDMAYAQIITPGFKIVFEAGGASYEYHTDMAGNFTLVD